MRKKTCLFGVFFLILLLCSNVSAATENFSGMLVWFEIMIATFALILFILSVLHPAPVLPLFSGIFWIVAAFGASKITYPFGTGAGIDVWYFLGNWQLTLLFGFIAFFMFITAIYRYISLMKEERLFEDSDEYWTI